MVSKSDNQAVGRPAQAYLMCAIGLLLTVVSAIMAEERYEYTGAAYSGSIWMITGAVLLLAFPVKRSDDRKASFLDTLVICLFAFEAAIHLISWVFIPNICASGRLSTSPAIVVLCYAGSLSALIKDRLSARRIALLMVPLMAAGRFTFDILGGAPPFSGWNTYEIRFVSELFLPVLIYCLCLSKQTYVGERRTMFSMLLKPFLQDNCYILNISLKSVRKMQLVLCVLSVVLYVICRFEGGLLRLYTLLSVPLVLCVGTNVNNKNLVAFPILIKMASDIYIALLSNNNVMLNIIIIMDAVGVVLALKGNKKAYSLAMLIIIAFLISALLQYSCSTVARNAAFFYRQITIKFSEIIIYLNLLLFGYGRMWSARPILELFMMDLSMGGPEDWVLVKPSDYEMKRNK